jgi:hypothetical protein
MNSLEQYRMEPGAYAKAVADGKLKHAYPTTGNDLAAFTRRIHRIDRIPVNYPYAQKDHTLRDGTPVSIYFGLPDHTGHLSIGERVAISLWYLYTNQQKKATSLHSLSVLNSYDEAMTAVANGDWGASVIGAAEMVASRSKLFSVIGESIVANAQREAREYAYFSPAVRIRRPRLPEMQNVSIRCYP